MRASYENIALDKIVRNFLFFKCLPRIMIVIKTFFFDIYRLTFFTLFYLIFDHVFNYLCDFIFVLLYLWLIFKILIILFLTSSKSSKIKYNFITRNEIKY